MGENFLRRVIVKGPTTITGGRDGELRIRFDVKMWHSGSPNMATIIITNPSPSTVATWQKGIGTDITLSAGYESNCGSIFQGQIKQVVSGHETPTETFLTVYCADNDTGYRKAIVTKTLTKGWKPQDKVDAALEALKPFGVTMGVNNLDLSQPVYPRGTPLIGLARGLLREVTLSAGGLWSIQMGKLMLTPKSLDTGNSATITLTAATGLIGWPQQTADGITFRSLINPALQPLAKVTLDPSQIIAAEQNNNTFSGGPGNSSNFDLNNQGLAAGTYTVYKIDRVGGSRDGDFFDECVCIGQGGNLPGVVKEQGYGLNGQ